jgi:hypothetical protein
MVLIERCAGFEPVWHWEHGLKAVARSNGMTR